MTALPSAPVVLVTGAARRVGRCIALHLAAQGWRVAIHARHSLDEANATADEARRASGHGAAVFVADLADEAACRALVPQVVAQFGRLDALVNNASLFEFDDSATLTGERLQRHMATNTLAPLLLTQALADHLAQRAQAGSGHEPQTQRPWPCAVHILDQKLHNPNPDHLSYTLSKAALKEAVRLQAMALAPRLRVVGISPGLTLVSGPMNETEFDAARRMTPLQRSSTPEDIARAVAYALDSPALTGCDLLVDGGQHLMGQGRDVLFLAQNALSQL
ncbi:SDR family oxidoreductase [Amphibiibacter pelophylacis]|uniref:SDR family oxidoreductase n=1 Tax=Amphibiibacter pelophylacis TaxID=1799477 RepID=A0ACC6P2E6_9BURK